MADSPFIFSKNPYHLFVAVRKHRSDLGQTNAVAAINERLHPKRPQISEQILIDLLWPAYIDLADERAERDLRAMNDVLSSELGVSADLAGVGDQTGAREELEKLVDYKFPDPEDISANADFNDLRGIWQLVQPSLKHDDVSLAQQVVRIAAVVIYGFVTNRQTRGRGKKIGLILVGHSTVWKAEGWISAAQKLYVHAHDCVRHGTHELLEDQFLVFDVRSPDPYSRNREILEGVIAGTSLDPNYYGKFPTIAAACVIRKLKGWSEWFKDNDRLIDLDFAYSLRDALKLDYYDVATLTKASHDHPFNGRTSELASRNQEALYRIAELLQSISGKDGLLLKPTIRRSASI